jgi:predicted cupin superfamily sugar epimerase
MNMSADEIIRQLELAPHPEGGHFRETWRANAPQGQRPSGTCIYFLLKAGENSHWHRVDADEIWLYHAGAPLVLSVSDGDHGPRRDLMLGPDLTTGQAPQRIVPKDHW